MLLDSIRRRTSWSYSRARASILAFCVWAYACSAPPAADESDAVSVPAQVDNAAGAGEESAPSSPTPRQDAPVLTEASAESGPIASGGPVSQTPTDRAGDQNDDVYVGLSQPTQGFRIATRGREIPPNSDVEYCEVAVLPGAPEDEYLVGAVEAANGVGSHHLIVTVAEPNSLAERQIDAHEVGAQLPCIGADFEFDRDGVQTIAIIQTRYAKEEYAEGVGVRLHGGQRVIFDYHYANFGEKPLTARSAIAVHTLDPSAPITLATRFSFSNLTIDTPPATERTFTGTCTLEADALVSRLARHTHAQGTEFSVWFEGGPRHGEQIWTSQDWEHDTVHRFVEPVLVRAGEGFRYRCGFRNQGQRALRFGISSTDEMCILGGDMWSPIPGVELPMRNCLITWVDEGGIGRDARAAGGFPKAEPADALACHAGILGLGLFQACLGCMCDSCGTAMARCNADGECKPQLDCRTACQANDPAADCDLECEQQAFEHPSGIGLVAQVGECIASQCADSCMIDDSRNR